MQTGTRYEYPKNLALSPRWPFLRGRIASIDYWRGRIVTRYWAEVVDERDPQRSLVYCPHEHREPEPAMRCLRIQFATVECLLSGKGADVEAVRQTVKEHRRGVR